MMDKTKRITVDVKNKYDVIVGRGILSRSGELTANISRPCRVLIVTDDNVAPLYLDTVKRSFENAGFSPVSYVIPHGEQSKNSTELFSILGFAAGEKLTRSDIFAALGGGVVGDITGLAASLYLRGVKYVGIPTTLLSMVDSSVGGKTAVDLPEGKNLVGAFHQPSLVICDPDSLSTLPDEFVSDGSAEVVKYGMIEDKEILGIIENGGVMANVDELIYRSVKIKRDIVCRDEFDRGDRKLLNFGHTVGHAIEQKSNFTLSHGRAVAYGMVAVTAAAEKLSLCSGCNAPLLKALKACGLGTELPEMKTDELIDVMLNDKKREGDNITLVLPRELGKCALHDIPVSELRKTLFFS